MSKVITIDSGSFNGAGHIINWDNVKYITGISTVVEDGAPAGTVVEEIMVYFTDGSMTKFPISMVDAAQGIYRHEK